MNLKKLLPHITLITVFTLLAALAVRAGFADSVQVKNVDAGAFPRIVATLEGEDLEGVSVKHIQVSESGKMNHGPMVHLPPATPSGLVDLFVILDHTGNTSPYSEALQMNLKALVETMEADGVDVNVYLTTFHSPDSPVDQVPAEFSDAASLSDHLDGLGLNGADLAHTFGLNKLYYFSTLNARPGAEKVALVLNGTPFYTYETHPSQTTYTVADTVNQLTSQNFITFVVGSPFKALHALKNEQVEDASLSHAMAGGYVGGFATDLPVIHQLLQARSATQSVLMYYSNLGPDQTGPVQLYIQGELASSFHYPNIDRSSSGYFTHLNAGPVKWGEPVTIAFWVNPIHQLVGLVEFYYLDKANEVQRLLAEPKLIENNEGGKYYQVELDAYDHPEEYFRYNVIAHTPFGPIGSTSDLVSLPVALYDEGMTLESTLFNDSILWKWSGPTVDEGILYQLWAGDELIEETAQKQFEVPITDCFRYQIMQVRAKVNGKWSHFSAPAEAYLGPQGTITEQKGIELMLDCVEDGQLNSVAQVIQGFNSYDAGKSLYLEKALYYLTRVVQPEAASQVDFGRYRLLYLVLGWISQAEHDEYNLGIDFIPQSLLYKLISQVNHVEDLEKGLEWGLHELLIRLQGHPTI